MLIFINFINLSLYEHVNPTIGLVNELLKKGDEITYICDNEFKTKFKKLNVNFIGFNENLNSNVNIKERMINILERHLKKNRTLLELALKEQKEFDYIVVDPFIIPGKNA